jgi:hypothetical protein
VRIVLWLLVLVTVCAALLLWNERVSVQARAERETLRGAAAADSSPTSEEARGFGHVLVGEKSGAPILEPEPLPTPPPGKAGTETDKTPKKTPPPTAVAEDAQHATEHTIAPGESLSTICQHHYGTSHPDVVAAVARANKLDKAGQIRAGMKIVLPPSSEVLKNKH